MDDNVAGSVWCINHMTKVVVARAGIMIGVALQIVLVVHNSFARPGRSIVGAGSGL